jgi:hypothetical protein
MIVTYDKRRKGKLQQRRSRAKILVYAVNLVLNLQAEWCRCGRVFLVTARCSTVLLRGDSGLLNEEIKDISNLLISFDPRALTQIDQSGELRVAL